jgi:hypothetical protein
MVHNRTFRKSHSAGRKSVEVPRNHTQAILDLHEQGLSGAEIGRHLGISRQAVSKILIATGRNDPRAAANTAKRT